MKFSDQGLSVCFLFQFLVDNKKAQRNILVVVEDLFGRHSSLKVVNVLKAFYDLDLIEEEVFIDWHSKVTQCLSRIVCFLSLLCLVMQFLLVL